MTVTGEDDANKVNETVTISHSITGYSGVSSVDSVTVTVVDDDKVPPVLTGATSTTSREIKLTWTHAGSSVSDLISGAIYFLRWQPSYRIKGASTWTLWNETSLGRISRRTRSFGLGNNYPDGAVLEVRIRARGSINGMFLHGPWSNTREVTYKNDNLTAVTITGATVTVTAGSSATYTVALTKAYGGTLKVTIDDTDTATVSPATLTFTTSTYNTAQTVTVTGVANGSSASIDHAFRLTSATADAIPDAGTVSVTVGAAVTIKPPEALAVVPGPDRVSELDGVERRQPHRLEDAVSTSYATEYVRRLEQLDPHHRRLHHQLHPHRFDRCSYVSGGACRNGGIQCSEYGCNSIRQYQYWH